MSMRTNYDVSTCINHCLTHFIFNHIWLMIIFCSPMWHNNHIVKLFFIFFYIPYDIVFI